jgi:hypothetical protein
MGLTVTCARCHDHKSDPIPTKDYYALHGVFASSQEPEEKPLLGPLEDSPAYREFLAKRAEVEAKIKEREDAEVAKFLAETRAKTGDYLLAADEARRTKPAKPDVFAGARKLNAAVLARWQAYLETGDAARHPVLRPWFERTASSPATEAAGGAEAAAGGADHANPLVRAALAKLAPDAPLKDVAAAYNALAKQVETGGGADTDAAAAEVRELLRGEGRPAAVPRAEVAVAIRREINNKTAPLKRDLEALNWTEPGAPLRAMALVDKAEPANSRVLVRGNPANRGPEVPRQFLEVLAGEKREPFRRGSGRPDLAEAIVAPDNPLTARVIVNRVWGWHFGTGLVRTPSDFGVRTEAPLHRELLDWLAASFVEQGWSLKTLHRWIVLSATYRQASDGAAAAPAADPDNRLWHRFERRRLEWEALRDTLLAVSGQLDPTAGGRPDDLTAEPFARRRTVYGFLDRQNLPGMFRTFDYPNPDTSTAQRFATTVPQQALYLLNAPFVQAQARALAARPDVAGAAEPAAQVRALYRWVLQRAPEASELAAATAFLGRPQQGEPEAAAGTGWLYGYGAFEAATGRTTGFTAMPQREGGRATPAKAYPDAEYAYLSVTATGGHPGPDAARASIRRWTAPRAGTVKIDGVLAHAAKAGDGVVGRVVSDRAGPLGEWAVRDGRATVNFANLKVETGETIDFLVEPGGGSTHDTYTWAPNVAYTGRGTKTSRTWNARRDFETPVKAVPRLTRREELAQVLLAANELAFVD